MRLFSFAKFSPAGNTTVFLSGRAFPGERSFLCRAALSPNRLNAEQAAFVDADGIVMAGGEFCVNAARAYGAFLDVEKKNQDPGTERHYRARVANVPVELAVRGHAPSWQVKASFELCPLSAPENVGIGFIARLPGINHALVECQDFPGQTEVKAFVNHPSLATLPESAPAYGIIWWRGAGEDLEILPYVRVPAAGTAMIESSCGSGTLALSQFLAAKSGRRRFRIRQPSGDILETAIAGECGQASVSGSVDLVAQGTIWLPDPPHNLSTGS